MTSVTWTGPEILEVTMSYVESVGPRYVFDDMRTLLARASPYPWVIAWPVCRLRERRGQYAGPDERFSLQNAPASDNDGGRFDTSSPP